MAIDHNKSINNFISILLLTGYLCIGFIPNWEAVDKIAPQWLIMSLFNLLVGIYIFIKRKYFGISITTTLNSILVIIYFSFIVWAFFSYYYAINSTEVLVNIARQFNVMIMFIHMGILLFAIKQKASVISMIITIILFIEVYSVIEQAMEMIKNYGEIYSGSLKGVTANRNITAFSIAIKIPFVLFLVFNSNKFLYKFLYFFLIFGSLLSISMIQSRASFIAVGFILISFVIMNLFLFFRNKNKNRPLSSILYFIFPLVFAIFINQLLVADKGADAISRAATISLSTNDGSVNQRLRYYEDVLGHVKSNPIFGVGLGNWKLKSIDYDKNDIVGYIVPYHAHSDFIQLGAELGILGFILYLGLFICVTYFGIKLINKSILTYKDKVFIFFLIVSLGVYSIDANLNFPIARPQVLVVWTMILALINYYFIFNKNSKKDRHKNMIINNSFSFISILFIIPTIYITNSTYNSLKGQMLLLQDFNSNQFSIPIDQVDYIVPDIPNITVTTIPLKSVKARYYLNAKKYDKALRLLDEGTKANPYLYYSELLKSKIYFEKNQIDSAYYYGRKAFYALPNNSLHSSNYVNLLIKKGDINAINEAFELLTYNDNEINWKNYLIAASNFTPPKDKDLSRKAKIAMEKFPESQDFKNLYKSIAVGAQGISQSSNYSNHALQYYNLGDHKNATLLFEKAILANPLEYSYRENVATSYYLLGDLVKAEYHINEVINKMNPLNGKCEYIKALIYIKMGDNLGSCPLLQTSINSGYSQAQSVLDQYCDF